MDKVSGQCALCAQEVHDHSVEEGGDRFCCTGCHAVYQILRNQSALSSYQEHPIFQQAVRSGLISNPGLLEEIRNQTLDVESNEVEKLYLEVQEMWCPSCAELIKLVLLREKGVGRCVVDYATDMASIEYAPRYLSKERIMETIQGLGYRPTLFGDPAGRQVSRGLWFRFIVTAFLALNIMMMAYPLYATHFDGDDDGVGPLLAWVSFAASLPVIFYGAYPIIRRFWSSLLLGMPGMETLVVLGVGSAFSLSLHELWQGGTHVYFDSMSVIISLVLLGKIIESRSKYSAKTAMINLVRGVPRRGKKRMPDGTEKYVLMKEIEVGDFLAASAGEKIVLDGEVVEGEGACDESLMSGEAIPVLKLPGATVLAGTMIQQGRVVYRATSGSEQTVLQRILETVEQDLGHKTVYIRAADHIARWFVPVVLAIAGGTFLGITLNGASMQAGFVRAISVLLISCPCAIGIAAPLAESYTLNALAGLGVLVRNRGALALLGRETVFVFDKTGTVTEGKFRIVQGLEGLTEEEQKILKSLSMLSVHPISAAISSSLSQLPVPCEKFKEFPGMGISGKFGGKRYYLGSQRLMEQFGICCKQASKENSVFFSEEKRLIARCILEDRLKEDAVQTIGSIPPARTVLLSGDARPVVEKYARACSFDEWHGEKTPLEKRGYIERLREQGEIVCMVGDGVNDAPALTGAHVSISVVNAADISIQVSDLLLTSDRLQVIQQMRKLARFGQRVVKQNLFWAFFYNGIGIGLAVFGWLTPVFAAFAMTASSLIVLFNAKRIGRSIPNQE